MWCFHLSSFAKLLPCLTMAPSPKPERCGEWRPARNYTGYMSNGYLDFFGRPHLFQCIVPFHFRAPWFTQQKLRAHASHHRRSIHQKQWLSMSTIYKKHKKQTAIMCYNKCIMLYNINYVRVIVCHSNIPKSLIHPQLAHHFVVIWCCCHTCNTVLIWQADPLQSSMPMIIFCFKSLAIKIKMRIVKSHPCWRPNMTCPVSRSAFRWRSCWGRGCGWGCRRWRRHLSQEKIQEPGEARCHRHAVEVQPPLFPANTVSISISFDVGNPEIKKI